MLEKFLISIGLKQPVSVDEVISTQQNTVRPSGENRFIDDEKQINEKNSITIAYVGTRYGRQKLNLPLSLSAEKKLQ